MILSTVGISLNELGGVRCRGVQRHSQWRGKEGESPPQKKKWGLSANVGKFVFWSEKFSFKNANFGAKKTILGKFRDKIEQKISVLTISSVWNLQLSLATYCNEVPLPLCGDRKYWQKTYAIVIWGDIFWPPKTCLLYTSPSPRD